MMSSKRKLINILLCECETSNPTPAVSLKGSYKPFYTKPGCSKSNLAIFWPDQTHYELLSYITAGDNDNKILLVVD